MVSWEDEGGDPMNDETEIRELLLEAFTAGWQAGLAVTITNPRVLKVVESCFELWLREAVDEVEVLGFAFRGREDLPAPSLPVDRPLPPPDRWTVRIPSPRHAREK
jgi:hypothetical protein